MGKEWKKWNFACTHYENQPAEEVANDILKYFKYERDERPADMGDP